jgi:hypothetical protein
MKLPFKHGYRRQRAADGLPSIRQQEKEKNATRARRVEDEAAAVQARRVERDERLKTAKFSVEQEESSMRRGR